MIHKIVLSKVIATYYRKTTQLVNVQATENSPLRTNIWCSRKPEIRTLLVTKSMTELIHECRNSPMERNVVFYNSTNCTVIKSAFPGFLHTSYATNFNWWFGWTENKSYNRKKWLFVSRQKLVRLKYIESVNDKWQP